MEEWGPRRIRRIVLYAIVYLSAGAVFLMPLTIPMLRTVSDFSIYNAGWKGCSQFARTVYESGKEVLPLHTPFRSLRSRPEDENTALLIIGPTRPFTRGDAEYIARFAESGGTVLLANDFDQGNTLLEVLELGYRFSEYPIADLAYEKDPFVVACTPLPNSPITREMKSFTLNYPAAITGVGAGNAKILARTSRMSWLDANQDGEWQMDDESRSSFPVLIEQRYGRGQILILSDPSVFINGMIDLPGNRELLENLLDYLTGADVTRVYIDEEHHSLSNPVEVFTVVVRRTPDYPRLLMVWILVTAAIILIHPRSRQGGVGIIDAIISLGIRILTLGVEREKPETVDPVAECLERHPDWELETLRKLAGRGYSEER